MDERTTLPSILRKHGFRCTRKQYKWCLAFTDPASKGWFSAVDASALAGYEKSCWQSAGIENYKKFRPALEEWLDFTEVEKLKLKQKFFELMEAKEVKFFANNGLVVDEREVEALSIQLKAATEVGKIIGAYAPEKTDASIGVKYVIDTGFDRDPDEAEGLLR